MDSLGTGGGSLGIRGAQFGTLCPKALLHILEFHEERGNS